MATSRELTLCEGAAAQPSVAVIATTAFELGNVSGRVLCTSRGVRLMGCSGLLVRSALGWSLPNSGLEFHFPRGRRDSNPQVEA